MAHGRLTLDGLFIQVVDEFEASGHLLPGRSQHKKIPQETEGCIKQWAAELC